MAKTLIFFEITMISLIYKPHATVYCAVYFAWAVHIIIILNSWWLAMVEYDLIPIKTELWKKRYRKLSIQILMYKAAITIVYTVYLSNAGTFKAVIMV